MNKYRMMKNQQQERVNAFLHEHAFFAFDKGQYLQGLEKLGLTEADAGQLVAISGGGYLPQEYADELTGLLQSFRQERQEAVNDQETGRQFAIDMFAAVLNDYEYGYTGDTGEALEALQLTQEEINSDPVLKDALETAMQKYR